MNCSAFTLFIGDLSVFCTKDDLVMLFSAFGVVTDVRIVVDTKTGKNLSYGFIDFDNIGSAANAMRAMNGYVLGGRRLRIQWGAEKTARKADKPKNDCCPPDQTSSVHVMFCSTVFNVLVTEESLRSVFGVYGCVADVVIKKLIHNSENNSNEGYGFVHFTDAYSGIDAAVAAVASLDNTFVDGVFFRVSMSKAMERKMNNMAMDTSQHLMHSYQPAMCYPRQPPMYASALPSSPMPVYSYVETVPMPYYAIQAPPMIPCYVLSPPAHQQPQNHHHHHHHVPVAMGADADGRVSASSSSSSDVGDSASPSGKLFESGVPTPMSSPVLMGSAKGARVNCGAATISTTDLYHGMLKHSAYVHADY